MSGLDMSMLQPEDLDLLAAPSSSSQSPLAATNNLQASWMINFSKLSTVVQTQPSGLPTIWVQGGSLKGALWSQTMCEA
ncbi:hypothetical protein WOLCODRAFT_153955 [Wolfiporia cocos MD-104 SS10]|uniref:Uncharacterized protein n=1 Tax=Wolfiporia cocos (strain MD-104) TaxID=742152 RepID=A0A2H3JVA3_WOLCO|nr:hypothetical protein WOLCODRAFT_153955 [Wolfiporia cocos MD-104 SS10]